MLKRLFVPVVLLSLYGALALAQPLQSYNFVRDSENRPVFGIGARPIVTGEMGVPIGTPFFDTSDKIFYYWSGSAWTAAVSVGGMADPGASGIMVRTAVNVSAARTFTTSGGIVISNADGVAAAPDFSYDSATIPDFSSGAGTAGATGRIGTFYFETDTLQTTVYPNTDTGTTFVSLPLASATPTDDNTLVGSGTAWAKAALPDCDDSVGQHLNYDTGTNAWSCGTSGASAAFDPGTTIEFYDEFIGGNTSSGGYGNENLSASAIASGTFSNTVQSTASHFGVVRLLSAAGDNSGYALSLTNSNGQGSFVMSSTDWDIDVLVMPGSNSTAITNTSLYVGAYSSPASDPNVAGRAVWVRYDTDLADGTFIFAICDSATTGCNSAGDATNQKVVASTITPVAGTWYRIRIRSLASGVGGNRTIYFRVNSEAEKTFCSAGCDDDLTQLDTVNSQALAVTYMSRTTVASLSADVDYIYFKQTGLTRY